MSPINGSAPRFHVTGNPPPNEAERKLAAEIASALGYWGPVDADPVNLAGMLALVRDGYTLPGPRAVVGGTAQLPRSAYAGRDGERAIESATDYAWRSWSRELHRRGLRPCGWPTAQRTYLAMPNAVDGWVEVDSDRAEVLMISVSCEAVPIT